MKMTHEEVKQAILDEKIKAISIDTSIFDGQQLGLEYGLLKRVEQFNHSDIEVVLPDIVLKEVEAHLSKKANETEGALKKALKAAKQSWLVTDKEQEEVLVLVKGTDSAESIAKMRLSDFQIKTGAAEVKAEGNVHVGELVDMYFKHQPPFAEKETKKHEFPDAIALLALEAWAIQNDTMVLAVAKDRDWKAYCDESSRLVVIDNLGEALGLFQREAAKYACAELSNQIKADDPSGIAIIIEDAVKEQVDNIEFIIDADSAFHVEDELYDYEIEAVEIWGLDESESLLSPIEYDENNLVASVSIIVIMKLYCNFHFSSWDSIDKEYIPILSSSITMDHEIETDALVTFTGRVPEKAVVENVELEQIREYVDFGTVEPDWGDGSGE